MTGSLDKSGKKMSAGQNDPFEDVLFLEDEIDFWVRDILKREDWNKFQKVAREKRKLIEDLHKRVSGLKIKKHQIALALKNSNLEDRVPSQWTDDEILNFSKMIRIVSKPMLIIANKIDKLEVKKLKRASRIIVVTEEIKKYYISLGIREKKFVVLSNGVNTEIFKPLNKKKCRLDLCLNDNPIILFVGAFRPYSIP